MKKQLILLSVISSNFISLFAMESKSEHQYKEEFRETRNVGESKDNDLVKQHIKTLEDGVKEIGTNIQVLLALSTVPKSTTQEQEPQEYKKNKFIFIPIQPKSKPLIDKKTGKIIDKPEQIIYDQYPQDFDESFKNTLGYLRRRSNLFCKVKSRDIPNQILLYGEKGSGKSYLVSLIAKKFRLPFLSIRGNDLEEGLYGDTSKKITDLFSTRDLNGKTLILLIEEIDLCFRNRKKEMSDASLSMVTSLLDELGRQSDPSLFTFLTTNNKDILDNAALSRFEKVEIKALDEKSRLKYMEFLVKKFHIEYSGHIKELSKAAKGLDRREIKKAITTAHLGAINATDDMNAYPTVNYLKKCLEQKVRTNEVSLDTKIDTFIERWNPRVQFANSVTSLIYNFFVYPFTYIRGEQQKSDQNKKAEDDRKLTREQFEFAKENRKQDMIVRAIQENWEEYLRHRSANHLGKHHESYKINEWTDSSRQELLERVFHFISFEGLKFADACKKAIDEEMARRAKK